MTRTTDHHTMPAPTPLTTTTQSDPLLQLENETEPPSGPGVNRCLNHADELALGGIPVICSACKARRDWLLINQGRNVYIRCRCANEWLEPEITRADFGAMVNGRWTNYPTLDAAITDTGFDGSFGGMYLT
ncbi:hypothetical protein ACIGXM_25135 [Kitasatospora sp. NPDC052896]|uniref:hypothetical protein n=1 Tax=Kitasatospora sp. NPDC052896 TaxID=3364061 RepID=UPI0037C7889D